MAYKRVLYEKIDGNIVKVTMNRPERRNAQDHLMMEEMQDAFIQADLDEDVRVIILAGAGKDFCAGHDISGKGEEVQGLVLGKAMATKLTGMEKNFKIRSYIYFNQGLTLHDVSKPTIAMVQGKAIAGGWLVASMCDLIVASDDAQFIEPIVKMAASGLEILFYPYDIGFRKAKEMLWTGDTLSAQEAKQLGMASLVVPRDKLYEETLQLARKIAASPPVAVSLIKRSVNHALDEMGWREASQYQFLIHELSHCSDEGFRWHEKAAKGTQEGVLSNMRQKEA